MRTAVSYPLIRIEFRVMHMWPPVKDPMNEYPMGVSMLIDNFFGRWQPYGPAMWPSRLNRRQKS